MVIGIRIEARTKLAVAWVELMKVCAPILGSALACKFALRGAQRLTRFRAACVGEPFPEKWSAL